MASRKENLKSLFSNTRTRVIIIFTVILLVIAVVIGYVKLKSIGNGPLASADVTNVPGGIQSIPGALDPTEQYAKLQEQQNQNQAQQAENNGGSAIPTIIRIQALGNGVDVVGSSNGKSGGIGFSALSRKDNEGAQQSLWIQDLQNGSCSKRVIDKVVSEGAQLSDLKSACSCVQLKDIGYALPDLEQICQCSELKAAGYNARQLKETGYTSDRLRTCGFDACELRNAGFTAQEMKDGGFPDGELKGAGFSDADILKASGLPDGITAADVRNAGCGVDALTKLRQAGVTASAIRRISGCSAEQLKAAGFTAKDLKDAGFSAADLRKAGFTPDVQKDAGYAARDLLNSGFNPDDAAQAGFTAGQIKAAETEMPPGITADDIKNAGCDVDVLKKEKAAGVSATLIKQDAGCSAQALKAAGFSDTDLANAGFNPQDIAAASPLSDEAIKAAGCDPAQLKTLYASGVSAQRIKALNGCSAQALKDAGFNTKSLLDAGITPAELLATGLTPKQLEDADLNPAAIIAAGRLTDCSVDTLKKARAAGISALAIKQTLGCSAKALKDAGYTAKDLRAAGFTAAELKAAGFTPKELKDAGFSPKELKDAGFNAKDLKDAGFSAADLKNAGFSAAQLKAAGFSTNALKAAGFSAKDLKDAGLSADELKNAGYTTAELKNAGVLPEDSQVSGLGNPNIPQSNSNLTGVPSVAAAGAQPTTQGNSSSQQLQAILTKQNQQLAEQKYQQKIQQRTAEMVSAANQSLQDWKKVSVQVYTEGSDDKKDAGEQGFSQDNTNTAFNSSTTSVTTVNKAIIRTGDIVFAVMDTSVNSDEPGPILATIVSGKLKGTKLIGSFNLPSNANKMVITFNTMSVPGAAKTSSISAFAIDPNTARTALSSRTDHHYLMRYGSLFASSFIEGFGNAFQSANTTITIGGTGGGNNITVQNGVGRSTLQNAVIGLATVGKSWGQQAQQMFNTPTTVEVYAGTGIGVLFTQDVTTI